jgi:hypothetical protein
MAAEAEAAEAAAGGCAMAVEVLNPGRGAAAAGCPAGLRKRSLGPMFNEMSIILSFSQRLPCAALRRSLVVQSTPARAQ